MKTGIIPMRVYWRPPTIVKAALIVVFLVAAGCFSRSPQTRDTRQSLIEPTTVEIASFYGTGDGFAGKKTASGEIYDPNKLTAAHRSLPFGTRVKVTNRANGKSVVVRINDRGPFIKGRSIDLSTRAASHLGFREKGTARVTIDVIPENM